MGRSAWILLCSLGAGGYGALRAARAAHGTHDANAIPGDAPHVVILGAGFGGLAAAGKLRELAPNRCRITLIDQHNYHLFTPTLYQVAACGVAPYDAAFAVREFAGDHAVVFRTGTVTGIDLDRQQVKLENGEVAYDRLILALGSSTNFFGNQAAQANALPLKWLEDGVAIRNRVLDMLEEAANCDSEAARRTLLTFVVIGGGATGVETAAALAGLLQQIPAEYPGIKPDDARVVVLEGEDKLLGHMSQRMSKTALKSLKAIGVDVRLKTKAKDVQPGRVVTSHGAVIDAHTVIWSAGVRAPDLVQKLDAQHGKGGSVTVDEYLRLRGRSGVYAIGDNADFEDAKTGKSVPPLAAAAVQEGEAAARNILNSIEGEEQVRFHYRPLGNAVSLGSKGGVAEIGGVVVGGVWGWLVWRLVHLVRITSFRNKLATALDWSTGYLYRRDTVRLALEPKPPAAGNESSGQNSGKAGVAAGTHSGDHAAEPVKR